MRPAKMTIAAASQRSAEAELNEPQPDKKPAVIAAFKHAVVSAIGEEAASQLEWAILAALRQSKWDTDKALERMQKLATFKEKNAQYFDNQTPQEFAGPAAIGMTSHLPTRTKDGELVMLIDGQKLKEFAKQYTMRDMLRYSVFYMALLLHDEETQVCSHSPGQGPWTSASPHSLVVQTT